MKIGTITFGKSRPAPKQVLVDVTMDDKTQQELHKVGLKLLAKDSEAVIEYVIRKALQYVVKE